MTILEETFVALALLKDHVDYKNKSGILLCSFPEEFNFLLIMADLQNMNYDSICAILKADAKRKKRFQNTPDKNAAGSSLNPTPMPAARLADVPPTRAPGKMVTLNYRQTDMQCL